MAYFGCVSSLHILWTYSTYWHVKMYYLHNFLSPVKAVSVPLAMSRHTTCEMIVKPTQVEHIVALGITLHAIFRPSGRQLGRRSPANERWCFHLRSFISQWASYWSIGTSYQKSLPSTDWLPEGKKLFIVHKVIYGQFTLCCLCVIIGHVQLPEPETWLTDPPSSQSVRQWYPDDGETDRKRRSKCVFFFSLVRQNSKVLEKVNLQTMATWKTDVLRDGLCCRMARPSYRFNQFIGRWWIKINSYWEEITGAEYDVR